jgi:hypothetical protein
MRLHVSGGLLALALGVGLSTPAAAQQKPTIAVLPAQYFAAEPDSAKNITQGLVDQFQRQGYEVKIYEPTGWNASQHYADRQVLEMAQGAGTDLVAYPRLLALGLPLNNPGTGPGMVEPSAVIHLRVLNVRSGYPIYFRQVGHEYRLDMPPARLAGFSLPQPVATATAAEVTSLYFERVAGSRQESRGRGQ